MPVLFVVAFIAFVVLFINERVLVCYYYREPPSFDEEITMKAMGFIKWIPIFSLPVVFWQFGNRQIFESQVEMIDRQSDIIKSNHDIKNAMMHVNPLFMTYNSAPFFLLVMILGYWLLQWLGHIILDNEEDEDD
jgi:hypothetical protein